MVLSFVRRNTTSASQSSIGTVRTICGFGLPVWVISCASRVGWRGLWIGCLIPRVVEPASANEGCVTASTVGTRIRISRATQCPSSRGRFALVMVLFGFVRGQSTGTCKTSVAAVMVIATSRCSSSSIQASGSGGWFKPRIALMPFRMMIYPVRNTTNTSARADGRIMYSSVSTVLMAVVMFLSLVRRQTSSASKTSVAAQVVIASVRCLVGTSGISHVGRLIVAVMMGLSFMSS